MPKASTWHAALNVAVKFLRRSPGNPSAFVHNWRSVGAQPEMPTPIECPERIRSILDSLAISTDLIASRSLVLHPEAQELVVAEIGDDGREYLLAPEAAAKWRGASAAAGPRGVGLKIRSAVPSVDQPG